MGSLVPGFSFQPRPPDPTPPGGAVKVLSRFWLKITALEHVFGVGKPSLTCTSRYSGPRLRQGRAMTLDQWADDHGHAPHQPTIGQWLTERPDLREEIIDGWRRGYTAQTIASYLQDKHDCPYNMPSIRGYLVVIAGARGRT